MPDPKPSLGRIVLYTPPVGTPRHNGAREWAGMIGQMHDEDGTDTVHLVVYPPGEPPRWVFGVQRGNTGQLPQGSWRWPPRAD